jgi:serine phosphatase RsbU (regulator of sigma subunit)
MIPETRSEMFKRIRPYLIGLFFALMFLYIAVNAYRVVSLVKHYDGWEATTTAANHSVVTTVDPNGPAAGVLHEGDQIVKVNGLEFQGEGLGGALSRAYSKIEPGGAYTLGIRRAGQQDAAASATAGASDLETITLHTQAAPNARRYGRFAGLVGIILIFYLAGLIIFLIKPMDKQSILLALILGMFAAFPQGIKSGASGLPIWFYYMLQAPVAASTIFFAPVFLHFFLIFPEGERPLSPMLRRWPRLERYIYYPVLFFFIPASVLITVVMMLIKQEQRAVLGARLSLIVLFGIVLAVTYMSLGLVSLIVNYRNAEEMARRRMRIVVAGSLAAFLPLLLLMALNTFGLNYINSSFLRWMDFMLLFTLPLMPLSFAYAIIRHRIIPISFIIRRGARYLLVSRGSAVLEALAVGVLMFFLMDAFFSRIGQLSGRAVGVISGVVAIVVWSVTRSLHRRVIAPAIDRRFFRHAYDTQTILSELVQSLRTVTGVPKLLELTAARVQEAMHASRVTFFLRDEQTEDYTRAFSSEHLRATAEARPLAQRIARDNSVIERLRNSTEPLEADDGDDNSRAQVETLDDNLSDEQETLNRLGSALLLPLGGGDGMLGLISLGPRLGDLPYSGDDKRLLMAVAGQLGFALENARLVERMIEEGRRRQEIEAENERRAKELEEARQLQLSMLPKSVPQLPHLEIAAYMKPATEVGGDYYDFHLSADGTLTIAVGDATGHGLRAGTMVTAAKSLFRTFADEPDLTQVFTRSTRVLKEMNLRALYMAMMLLKIRGSHALISAAGMPPLLIYRSHQQLIEEVAIRGMPLGSFTNFPYRQQEFRLATGDIIVLMSDGFPERLNESGEMLDYAQARKLFEEVTDKSPQEIINHLVNSGDAWANGRAQDDDVTFVVLKVKQTLSP